MRLPERPNFHHFRFEYFSKKTRFRRVRDVITDKDHLKKTITRQIPKNVFFSPIKWLDPVNVRRRSDKNISDYMLSSPLYFDIDRKLLHPQTWRAAIRNTKNLLEYMESKSGKKPDWIVFSGSEGFHIYYWNWDDIPTRYSLPEKRVQFFIRSRRRLLQQLHKKGITVDDGVTSDPWRVLRVPGTLHGDTGFVAKLFNKLDEFSIKKTKILPDY